MALYAENGATEHAQETRAAGRERAPTGGGSIDADQHLALAGRSDGFPNRRAARSGSGSPTHPGPETLDAPSDPLSWVEQLRPGATGAAARRRPNPLGRALPALQALVDLSFTEVAVARFARTLFLAGGGLAILGWLVATLWAFSVGPAVGTVVLFTVGAAAAFALLAWRAVLELATLGVRLSDQLGALQKRAVFERRVFRDH